MKKKRLSVYLDERQIKFLADHTSISKQSLSETVRYALNKLQAEYEFAHRDYQAPLSIADIETEPFEF